MTDTEGNWKIVTVSGQSNMTPAGIIRRGGWDGKTTEMSPVESVALAAYLDSLK